MPQIGNNPTIAEISLSGAAGDLSIVAFSLSQAPCSMNTARATPQACRRSPLPLPRPAATSPSSSLMRIRSLPPNRFRLIWLSWRRPRARPWCRYPAAGRMSAPVLRFRNLSDKDDHGNAARGAAVFGDSRNCNVTTDRALVALEGIDDLVVVATQDAVLVSRPIQLAGLGVDLHVDGRCVDAVRSQPTFNFDCSLNVRAPGKCI